MCRPFFEVRQDIKVEDRQKRANKAIRDKKIKIVVMIGVIAVVTIGIGLAIVSSKAPNAAAVTIDGVQCNNMEQLVFHIHAHLDIFINGQPHTIPSQIGITGRCFYWLHTHDESGVIHIESPAARDYTLGQFFDIWNKTSRNNQIFGDIANGKNTPTVYVNGKKLSSGVNYKDIKLNQHDEIAIVYGKPPANIPSSYNFTEGL